MSRSFLRKTLAVAAALLLGTPGHAMAAQTTLLASGALAPPLVFANPVNLNFGELVVQTAGSPGSLQINPTTLVSTLTNASQIGTATPGSIDLTGRQGVAVVFTIVNGAWVCDVSYIGGCTGTPALTVAHSFTGQISAANCPGGGLRCTDRIYVGGTFAFGGTEEGRWTTTLTLTANYQ